MNRLFFPPPLPRVGWSGLCAALLLGLFWWQAVSASRHWSQTSDELPHITAGYAYDRFGDFRFQPENGIFPQRVHGLAPWLLAAKFPTNEAAWHASDHWQLGWDLLYDLDNPTDRIMFWARALNALFGVGLGLFIYLVARRWHGTAGGLLALAFYCFCPNFLAHSALATSDLAGTLCLTLAAWFFWRHLGQRTVASGVVAGVASGLAMVAKYNGVFLLPIYAILGGCDAWRQPDWRARARRLLADVGLGAAQGVAAALVIWAFYGFRYAAAAPGLPALAQFYWPWPPGLPSPAWKELLAQFRHWHLLPESYLQGFEYVLASEVARPAFLAGEYSTHGWRVFFPVMFLVKTPLAMLGALLTALLAAGVSARKRASAPPAGGWLKFAPLAVPAVVTWCFALNSTLNIGHRHILPVYPVLFVAVGSLAALPRAWRSIGWALLLVQVAESAAIRPHYLAFFNQAAGGPARAYRLAVDSSLDWGQDLPALRQWLAQNRREGEPFYLSYFGNAWPPHYGVRPTRFLPALNLVRPRYSRYDYLPGLYCLSATQLAEVYSGMAGPWKPEWQETLQTMTPDSEIFDRVRFARLCKYLQHRTPDATAGYSILIFRLDAPELHAALEGPVTGW